MFECTDCKRVSLEGIVWVEKHKIYIPEDITFIGTRCEFCKIQFEMKFWEKLNWLRGW